MTSNTDAPGAAAEGTDGLGSDAGEGDDGDDGGDGDDGEDGDDGDEGDGHDDDDGGSSAGGGPASLDKPRPRQSRSLSAARGAHEAVALGVTFEEEDDEEPEEAEELRRRRARPKAALAGCGDNSAAAAAARRPSVGLCPPGYGGSTMTATAATAGRARCSLQNRTLRVGRRHGGSGARRRNQQRGAARRRAASTAHPARVARSRSAGDLEVSETAPLEVVAAAARRGRLSTRAISVEGGASEDGDSSDGGERRRLRATPSRRQQPAANDSDFDDDSDDSDARDDVEDVDSDPEGAIELGAALPAPAGDSDDEAAPRSLIEGPLSGSVDGRLARRCYALARRGPALIVLLDALVEARAPRLPPAGSGAARPPRHAHARRRRRRDPAVHRKSRLLLPRRPRNRAERSARRARASQWSSRRWHRVVRDHGCRARARARARARPARRSLAAPRKRRRVLDAEVVRRSRRRAGAPAPHAPAPGAHGDAGPPLPRRPPAPTFLPSPAPSVSPVPTTAEITTWSQLRNAVADPAVSTINVSVDIAFPAQIEVTRNVTIVGVGGPDTALRDAGAPLERLFYVTAGGALRIESLHLLNNASSLGFEKLFRARRGPALHRVCGPVIYAWQAHLELVGCTVRDTRGACAH